MNISAQQAVCFIGLTKIKLRVIGALEALISHDIKVLTKSWNTW